MTARTRANVVLITSALLLVVMHYGIFTADGLEGLADTLAELFPEFDNFTWQPFAVKLVWTVGTVVFYLLIPALIIRLVLREKLADHGLNLRGFLRHLGLYLALFVPVGVLVLLVASQPDFLDTYPLYRHPQGVADLIVWELLYGAQFIALEFFFRGFMLHGTKQVLGYNAIWVMVVPYVMIHFSKPLYETVGAVIAGSVLGFLSLRTRSIAGGALVHWLVAIAMDLAALGQRDHFFPQ